MNIPLGFGYFNGLGQVQKSRTDKILDGMLLEKYGACALHDPGSSGLFIRSSCLVCGFIDCSNKTYDLYLEKDVLNMSWKFIPAAAFTTALMLGSTASSLAQTAPVVSFQKMSEPAHLTMPHDARGIALGMSLEDTKNALAKLCNTTPDKLETGLITRSITYRGLAIKAAPYVGKLSCRYTAPDESSVNPSVEMSSPAVGNVAIFVEVYETWSSPVSAPSYSSTTDALKQKYGQSPSVSRDAGGGISGEYIWWFDTKGVPAKSSKDYSPYLVSAYADDSFKPEDLMIKADIDVMQNNPSAISSMTITLADGITSKKDMENMMSVFQKAGQDAFSHNNKSAAAL